MVGGFGVSQQQVVADGAAEECVALWHVGEGCGLAAGYFHCAFCRLYEAEYEAYESGLALSGGTYDGSAAAGGEVVGEVVENLASVGTVGECDVVEGDGDA